MTCITPLILDFVNFRTPELRRSPESRDPDGATLDLWLRYEGMKKYRWRGRASMDAGRLADALATIKDDGQVTLRLPYNWIPTARHPVLAEDEIGKRVTDTLSELFEAAKQAGPLFDQKNFDTAAGIARWIARTAGEVATAVRHQDYQHWARVAPRAKKLEEAAEEAKKMADEAKKAEDEAKKAEDEAKKAEEAKQKAEKARKRANEAKQKAEEARNKLETAAEEAKEVADKAKTAESDNNSRDPISPRTTNADLLLQVSNQRWTLPGVLWEEGDDE